MLGQGEGTTDHVGLRTTFLVLFEKLNLNALLNDLSAITITAFYRILSGFL